MSLIGKAGIRRDPAQAFRSSRNAKPRSARSQFRA
jgi:hypothetical protein